ncbi:MAG TPA: hypothetical protein VIN07_09190 [Flavipsychrobacter sp.]
MKKLLLLATVIPVLATTVAHAQPQKGDWLLGAKINPAAIKTGYFISNRSVIGVDLSGNFSYQPQGKDLNFNIGADATFRHYFAPESGMQPRKFYWFGDVNAGYQFHYGYSYATSSGVNSGLYRAGLAPGLAYFVNDRISIDAALRTNLIGNFSRNWSHLNAHPEFGVQVYLRGKKKPAKAE